MRRDANPPRSRALSTALAVAVGACVLAFLLPVRSGLPVSDDFLFMDSAASGRSPVAGAWPHPLGRTVGFRPAVEASYALNRRFCGWATCFRVANIAVHSVNAALVFWLAQALGFGLAAAALGGLLFGLHPTSHEAVVWISGRPTALSAAGVLLGLIGVASDRRRFGGLAAAGGTLLALLSYEGAVALPLLGIAVAVAVALRNPTGSSLPRYVLVRVWPVLLVAAVYTIFRWGILTSVTDDAWLYADAPRQLGLPGLWLRLADNGWAWFQRVLAAGYAAPSPKSVTFLSTALVLAWAGLTAWRSRTTRLSWALGVVLAVAAFTPFAGLIGFADRFAYASLIGVSLAIAAGLDAVLEDRSRVRSAAYAVACLLLLMGWTRQYRLAAGDWKQAGLLADRVVRETASLLAHAPCAESLHFGQLPTRAGRAVVFPTYFDLAVRNATHRADLDVTTDIAKCDAGPSPSALVLCWSDASGVTVFRHAECKSANGDQPPAPVNAGAR